MGAAVASGQTLHPHDQIPKTGDETSSFPVPVAGPVDFIMQEVLFATDVTLLDRG